MTRPPHLVIPGLPPPSSPTPIPTSVIPGETLLRHPPPRSPYATVILARRNVNPVSHRHSGPRPVPMGRARQPPQPSSPTPTPFHRRAGEGTSPRTPIRGRYPGDGAATTTTVIPHQHPLTPLPSCRRRNVTPYPDTGPVPRGRARQPPQP